MRREALNKLLLEVRALAVFREVVASPAAGSLLRLLELLAAEERDPPAAAAAGGALWRELAAGNGALLPDAWQSHLVERLLEDENAFSLAAERDAVAPALCEQARRELRVLQRLFDLPVGSLLAVVEERFPELAGLWTPWRELAVRDSTPHREVARKLEKAENWGELAEDLARHFASGGTGMFGAYRAFRWQQGAVRPVVRPDPVRLGELFGYERERERLVLNTERFLAGLPAHHALLYGLPGTGKSATVKALANEYAGRGLRLVELAKEELGSLPALLETLRERGLRFIVFVDDLSFEEHEVEYKALKALLEGSVAEPPENVRLYATSNRRNLIRERFSERDEADDVHLRDSMQEKLSLAARFGLRVTFLAPDRRQYLEIVSGLARSRGLEVSEEELRSRAARRDFQSPGRSGRTARQLVDELEAELSG
jgi:predicted AAA+ superfamily ATPase